MATLWADLEPWPPGEGPPLPRLFPPWPSTVKEYRDLQGGETIEAKTGSKFALSKPHLSALAWEARFSQDGILSLLKTYEKAAELSALGTYGSTYFVFQAMAAGQTNILLDLRAPNQLIPAAALMIQVVVS